MNQSGPETKVAQHNYQQGAIEPAAALPALWRAFIEYCSQLGHGEIELLRIQDGLPMMAEIVRKKVKFSA